MSEHRREWLQCIACAQQYDALEVRYDCDCGGLLSVERRRRSLDRDAFDDRCTLARADRPRAACGASARRCCDVEARSSPIPKAATRLYERDGPASSSTRARTRPARSRTAA